MIINLNLKNANHFLSLTYHFIKPLSLVAQVSSILSLILVLCSSHANNWHFTFVVVYHIMCEDMRHFDLLPSLYLHTFDIIECWVSCRSSVWSVLGLSALLKVGDNMIWSGALVSLDWVHLFF